MGPHAVKVESVPAREISEDEDASGDQDVDRLSLRINSEAKISRQAEIFLHELVHFWLSGLPLTEGMEEVVAVVVSRGLTSFACDNLELWKKVGEMALDAD